MLIYLYLFGLIVGGVLLGSSLLLGGHGDADGPDGADADAEAGLDKEFSKDLAVDGAGADFLLWRFKSVRFWTFFLAFFGLTGVLLEGLGLTSAAWVTLLSSFGMGSVAGFGATEAIRRLTADTSGKAADSNDYVGKSVRVIVPVKPGGTGKVRLQLKGSTVDVLAEGIEGEFASQDEAIIVEMSGTTARIARLEEP
jgi:membrane protein implicated in regulation of membrane protease activity